MHAAPSIASIRLYVVDPDAVVRAGIELLFRSDAEVIVVGDASTTVDLLSEDAGHPDVVIAEIATELSLADVEALLALSPALKVIAFTDREGSDRSRRFRDAGGVGYVLKSAPTLEGLSRAVHIAAAGGTSFDPVIASLLARRSTQKELSARELVVLQMLASGETMAVIATFLGVSARTVETYRTRGHNKLGIQTRTDLVRHARREGWFDLG